MAALMRMSQLVMTQESVEGTATTPVAGSQLPVLVGAKVANTIAAIKRDLMRGTLTNAQDMAGFKSGAASFSMELAGPLAGFSTGTASLFDLPLQACGMKRATLIRAPIEATWNSGTIVNDGATFTASGLATGKAWGDYVAGDTHIFLLVATGTVGASDTLTFTNPDATTAAFETTGANVPAAGYRPADRVLSRVSVASIASGPITDGQVLTGATSGAIAINRLATSGAGAQVLLIEQTPYSPVFTTGETITVGGSAATAVAAVTPGQTMVQVPSVVIGVNHASVIRNAIRGARGNWGASMNNGERALLNFNFQGPDIEPVDTVNFIFPANAQAVPAPVIGGLFKFDSTFAPAFASLSIDMGNELALRDLPSDATGSGYKSCVIVARNPSGSIDPETVKRAVYDIHGKAWGKTPVRTSFRIISATQGNSFEFKGRKTLFGNLEEGDRRGVLTTSVPMTFHGDPAGGADTNYGGDELLLLQW